MRAPDFWNRPPNQPGLVPRLLSPLGKLYAGATARRVAQGGVTVDVPVICVGNLNAGGVGKTPTVIWVLEQLRNKNIVVSRKEANRIYYRIRNGQLLTLIGTMRNVLCPANLDDRYPHND